jgi:putative lipoprotein
MRASRSVAAAVLVAGLAGGCATASPTALTGTVGYRERMALPEDAVVEVRLLDVSRQDAPAAVVAQMSIRPEGKSAPFSYSLPYDPAKILPEHRYVVRAVIRSGERTLFTTDPEQPVLTQGNPQTADLMLVRARSASADAETPPSAGSVVRGTVSYREKIALTPDAEIDLWITDTTPGLMTAAVLIAEATVRCEGRQVPIPFELSFDAKRIDPAHTYGLKAAIRRGGEVLFESEEAVSVITQGNPSKVALWLRRTATSR